MCYSYNELNRRITKLYIYIYIYSNSPRKQHGKKCSDRVFFSGGSLAEIIRPAFFCLAITVTYAVFGWFEIWPFSPILAKTTFFSKNHISASPHSTSTVLYANER
uniref:(northern house mosquito) hypothetical protein n=1 Tax=Culex pipiens TaxID=7175 RepID=A0A8D8AC67_CULPI